MKIAEARKIVKSIVNWQFKLMGFNDNPECLDLSCYTLKDIIKANDLVEQSNKRRFDHFYKSELGGSVSVTQSATLDDRIIAAVYTAVNFEPNGEIVALMNNIGVATINVKDFEP